MEWEQLERNLEDVRLRIANAARRSSRGPESVRLVGVTKRNPTEWVRPLAGFGMLDCGENYPQELWSKVEALADLPIRWHLIGHLQGNKAKKTFSMVHMIHAVDSLKLLRTLNVLAEGRPVPPSVCLQVNTSGEEAKHGWSPEEIVRDAEAIAACRAIPVLGLMTIAGYGTTPEAARPSFVTLRNVRDDLARRTGLPLDQLSMGMSIDFEAAIEEGATLVRVGSALFQGVRP